MTENRDNDMLSKEVIKPYRVGGKSKTPILLWNVDKKSIESVFDCHLSPHWRQMAFENTVSINF